MQLHALWIYYVIIIIVHAKKYLHGFAPYLGNAFLRMQAVRRCRFSTVRSTVWLSARSVLMTVIIIHKCETTASYYCKKLSCFLLPSAYTDLLSTNHPVNQPTSTVQFSAELSSHPVQGRTRTVRFEITYYIHICVVLIIIYSHNLLYRSCYFFIIVKLIFKNLK